LTFDDSLGRRTGGNNSGPVLTNDPSVRLFDIFDVVDSRSGDRVTVAALGVLDFGLAKISVADRGISVLDDDVDFSRFFERTVPPAAPPNPEVRRTDVFRERFVSSGIVWTAETCLEGEESGVIGFVVVKKPNTLSATILILALARLWVLLRWGGGGINSAGGEAFARIFSCGGDDNWRISPVTFW